MSSFCLTLENNLEKAERIVNKIERSNIEKDEGAI